MKAKYYILYTFLLISSTAISQKSNWTISGSVLDDKKAPVQLAIVFVNNTSIGIGTNEKGNFQLNIPNSFSQVELVIAVAGFQTLKRKINYSAEIQVFKFQLEHNNSLNEVSIAARHDNDWQKKWKIFEKALLGESKFAKECKILNPEVIKLEYDKDNNVVATAKEPILIVNNALGYKILFQMDKLVCDGITRHLSGLKFFEEIETNNLSLKTRWDKNRKDVFSSSFRNFLVALSLNKLEKNNFEVFERIVSKTIDNEQTTVANEIKAGALIATDATKIFSYDKDTESFTIHSEYPILVFFKKEYQKNPLFTDYPYVYSEIVLLKGYAGFNQNGVLNKPNSVILKNHWGLRGFSNMLPEDYNVEELKKETNEAERVSKIDQN